MKITKDVHGDSKVALQLGNGWTVIFTELGCPCHKGQLHIGRFYGRIPDDSAIPIEGYDMGSLPGWHDQHAITDDEIAAFIAQTAELPRFKTGGEAGPDTVAHGFGAEGSGSLKTLDRAAVIAKLNKLASEMTIGAIGAFSTGKIGLFERGIAASETVIEALTLLKADGPKS